MKESDDRDETVERQKQFEEGVEKLLNKLFGIAYSRTLDADLARDLVQEAAYRLYRRMNAQNWSQDIKSLDAYATTTVLHCLITHYRNQKKMPCVSLDSDLDEKLHEEVNEALLSNGGFTSVDDDMERQKLHEQVLRQLVDGLSENDMCLLELRRVDDRSLEEIAAITGKNVDSVKRQLQKIDYKVRRLARKYKKASGKKSFF
jgi:RNA polymerase sigma factor (sigma-70 family)